MPKSLSITTNVPSNLSHLSVFSSPWSTCDDLVNSKNHFSSLICREQYCLPPTDLVIFTTSSCSCCRLSPWMISS
ncbi:hypothetical protein COLO4_24998 [Corchorus olitorius]|uniref:Uncharacterized protein n=1 Tax=Corchorus olitorius TaxID=93759 RepID=A0A1R3I5H1_9ROSI|nr:hypothetical protein COLO4_24998 [Corchorus olitorius]